MNATPSRLSAIDAAESNALSNERKAKAYRELSSFLIMHKDTMSKDTEELIWSLCVNAKNSYYS